MKSTGLVRRIDDLGRIVIPKEIRNTMKVRCGDALEIFTDDEGGVIFRKYNPYPDALDSLWAARQFLDEDDQFYKEISNIISRMSQAEN